VALTRFLLERGTKLLVVACNSAAAAATPVVRSAAAEAGVEVLTVIGPEAEVAAAITENGRVGVLATPTTVSSGAYKRALEDQGRALEVTEVAGPDLAPIIQHGFPFDEGVISTVRSYCAPLKRAKVDTLVLGCTHYPLVAPLLQRMLGRDVRLVSAGHALAAAAQRLLEGSGLATAATGEGDYRFFCTGDVASFTELGTRFLQLPLADRVEKVQI
jgi:glutamate racemase